MSNKKYLDYAFEITAEKCPTLLKGSEAFDFLVTGIKAYAKANNYDFADDEIAATIKEKAAELQKAGKGYEGLYEFAHSKSSK